MRLYLNQKEVPVVMGALANQRELYYQVDSPCGIDICENLLERIDLCQQLQDNEKRNKK